MDFVSDSLINGRRLKCLTVADDCSHECIDIAVDYGISGQYVTRLLDQAAIFRGYPKIVRTDNGPEFTSRAFMGWALSHGIRHILIQPGRPMQNGYIESFNGPFGMSASTTTGSRRFIRHAPRSPLGGATTTKYGLMGRSAGSRQLALPRFSAASSPKQFSSTTPTTSTNLATRTSSK